MSIIYKYFNWGDEARKILTHQELYFVNADTWKKSGEFDFGFLPLDKSATKVYMENEILKVHNTDPKFYWRWLNVNLHKYFFEDYKLIKSLSTVDKILYEDQLVDKIIAMKLDCMENHPEIYEKEMRKWYFKHTGIFSTSTSNNSPQLWAWKSKLKVPSGSTHQSIINYNAICVGLDLDKVKAILDTVGNYSIAMVKYKEGRNQIAWVGWGDNFFIQRFNSITNTLRGDQVKDILQQQEVRITRFFTDNLSHRDPARYLQLSKDCISEIIIHGKAKQSVKENVNKYAMAIGCKKLSVFNP